MPAMFLGWRMVALSFLTNFISVGFVFYSYGVFFKALAADFGDSRLGVSLGLTAMNVVSSLLSPVIGARLDRGSIRIMMIIGAGLMGCGFLLASAISSLWQFYLVLSLVMGPGVCMLGALPSTTLVANWFVQRRGTALGIATMGVSLSGVLMPPLGTALIDGIGWRMTFVVYAAAAWLLVVPAVYRWVIQRPEDLGLRPDGASAADGDHEEPHIAAGAILRDRNFWLIALTIASNFCAMGAILTHAVPHATDVGFSNAAAAFVLSVMASAGALGKPVFGSVTDRLDKRIVITIIAGMQLVGLLLLMQARSYPSLLLAGAVFGFGMGGVVPLHGALIGAAFGRDAFGRVMGLMTPIMLPLGSAGIPLAGYLFDRTGTYMPAFQGFVGLFCVAILAGWMLRLPTGRTLTARTLSPVAVPGQTPDD